MLEPKVSWKRLEGEEVSLTLAKEVVHGEVLQGCFSPMKLSRPSTTVSTLALEEVSAGLQLTD